MRAAIYARVSTEDQAREGYSLPAQLGHLRSFCEARDWQVAAEYVDDGWSGRDTKRPAYQRMLAERDSWDLMLVAKMDRIHRNSRNFMIMMEDLEKWHKQFTSMNESLDTSTAVGRFVVDIISRIAQLESEQTGERTYVGMAEKAKSPGANLGGPAALGYRFEEGSLVLIEEEAMTVRAIFRLYLEGFTLDDVVTRLESLGIKTRHHKTWTKWNLSHVLHNPVYAGFRRWDGILAAGKHEAIVSPEDFNAVQVRIASMSKIRPKEILELPIDNEGFVSMQGAQYVRDER